MQKINHPYYPIIYVRGYAMTQSNIDATVSTPYMGFNLGATKMRQNWEGNVIRHIFESPLIRLMKDFGYKDIYSEGSELNNSIPSKSVIIHRYYEKADSELGGADAPSIEEAAKGLSDLILRVRDQVCGTDKKALKLFKVYLVAHSMGGLVCRCFLQNPQIGSEESKSLVDKVFTYATPHNGIEMMGMNVPSFLGVWDTNNFNRQKMASYLGFKKGSSQVNTLNGKFDPNRFFCLVGTNHKDYEAAAGISRLLAGEMSDGLVKINNAYVQGAPRAYVYRSHSGTYGIVNSEEGYQNLVRFLFGNIRVDGILEAENLPLPPSVEKAYNKGKKIRASYYFESTVAPRGSMNYKLTERRKETNSASLRKFDELILSNKNNKIKKQRSPVLFSVFLNTANITLGKSIVFGLEIGISTTGYEIDDFLFFDRNVPGEYIFRKSISVQATPESTGWNLRYNFIDEVWSESKGEIVEKDNIGFFIPLNSKNGFKGKLRINIKSWE